MHRPLSYEPHFSGKGTQTIYRFENLFGASVIENTPFNRGFLAELAFLRFEDANDVIGRLCVPDQYENSIISFLTFREVEEWLDTIAGFHPDRPYDLV